MSIREIPWPCCQFGNATVKCPTHQVTTEEE